MRNNRLPTMLFAALVGVGGAVTTAPAGQATATPNADVTPAALIPAPATVRADVLPTPQIDGVAWEQVIAGDKVYVGGQFTTARPFGSAPGVNTVPRSNLLAYDIRTGALDTSFSPALNGKVNDMAVTPDGSKLVVAGNFTQVNGASRYRVAVFNLPSGTLSNVAPSVDSPVQAVAVTNATMYLGGYFSSVSKTARARIAAVSLANGAVLPFTVPVDSGQVRALALSPDASQIVLGGSFTSVGGSSNPGYGLYRADAVTGAGLPLPVNSEVRNGGDKAAILKLASDGTSFYGGAYKYQGAGNYEGMFQASWTDGSLVNLQDCHGDTYDVAPVGDAVYVAGHPHYCGNSGGFPETRPSWTFWHSTAWTKATMGTNTADLYTYPDRPGTPRPELLPWFPRYVAGTYTGKSQATWTVAGNSQYVVYGGEFTRVNGISQQGLVRFAVRSLAPNKSGPQPPERGSFVPRVRSFTPGQVRVSWPALWDRDDLTLTYQLLRNNTLVHETSQSAHQWSGQGMTFTDTGLTPGSTPSYVVRAIDPDGNSVSSSSASTTVTGTNQLDAYAAQVLADGATKYWRLDDAGTTVADLSGPDYTTTGSDVARGIPGALPNSTNKASAFGGTINGVAISTNLIPAPNTFSSEVWFNTTYTSGGTIAGFGDGATLNSNLFDRHIYMDSTGKVWFGVIKDGVRHAVGSTTALNNGQWHQAVATLGPGGMALYIDGVRQGSKADVTAGRIYGGYWRVGGDLSWWGDYVTSAIDDFSVYPTELTPAQVLNHWVASRR